MNMKRAFVMAMVCIWAVAAYAQFNIKVGYQGAYHNLTEFNNQFSLYNSNHTYLEDPFPKVHVLHGLEVGFRYKIGNHVGVEATWINGQSKRIETSGNLPSGTFFEDKWRLNSNEYAVGIENYFGNLGYGASIGYRKTRISTDQSGTRKYLKVQEDDFLNLNLHLLITVETGNGTFALKPFYQAPLSDWNLDMFANNLNSDVSQPANLVENFKSFGLSFVFYNGPKSN